MFRFVSLFILLPMVSFASPPLEFTGILRDGGIPVQGEVNLTFYLYAEEADEVPIWTENHPGVQVDNGEFTVFLFDSEDYHR